MKMNITQSRLHNFFCSFRMLAWLFLGLSFQQSAAQNSCAAALPITAGTYTIAVIDGTNMSTGCNNSSLAEWYAYTPTENHSVTVTSDLPQNICKDTRMRIYTGTCGALTCYGGDDDSGIITCNSGSPTSYLSVDTFDAFAGTTYYIAWDNTYMSSGFDFQLTEAPFVPSPCYVATPITAGTYTVNAIDGGNMITSCSTAGLAKWYSYTPTSDFHVTVSSDLAQNICKDTNFSIYTGSCTGTLNCVASDDNSGNIACNSGNTNSNLSVKTFDVTAGTTYYIAWDNKWSAAGFDFQLTEVPIILPVHYNNVVIPTVNSAYNMCIVDMNNDGKDDIVGVSNTTLRVHFQGVAGALTYTDFTVPGPSLMPGWSIAAGDFNKDGYNDLLLGSSDGLTIWKSNATGTAYTSMTPGQYIFCQRTNFIDIDNDGNLDAFSCHDIAPNVYYLNDGSGLLNHYYQSTVTPGSYSLGAIGGNYSTLWTDYDNDGDEDVFISKCSGPPCELHRNDGNGVFTDVSAAAQINFDPVDSWSSAIFDYDNDGDMDILVGSNGFVDSRLFRNNLDTSNTTEEAFTNVTAGSGFDSDTTSNRDYVAYDFDNDGWVDVLNGNGRIMFNQGNGTFLASYYPNLGVGAIGDLNDDGFLDIENYTGILYAIPNGNHWITVHLTGVQSNKNGIGARVEIYGSWGKQIRDIRSGEGFGYMSSLNAHFGIGQATDIEKVIIRWPSGTVDAILNPTSDQMLSVTEGSSPLGLAAVDRNSFSLYPNPADDQLNIQLGSALAALKEVTIFDLKGRIVSNPTVSNENISVKNLSTGTYLLVLKTIDGKKYTQKFLKK